MGKGFTAGLFGLAQAALAACGSAAPVEGAPEPASVEISPTAFALLECGVGAAADRCVIVAAGGKRLLVGAPGGIGAALGEEGLLALDAVLLTGLGAPDLEGLDEVRNQGWAAGRRAPLRTAGPLGFADIARALNGAYQTSDAIEKVRSDPAGGFGAALIEAREGDGAPRWRAFDTGDLQVDAITFGRFQQAYRVTYEGVTLLIAPCGAGLQEAADHVLTCAEDAEAGVVTWPLEASPVFLVE